MTIASVILAAGMGTRMKSRLPKMLHPILGKPMILHALNAVLPHTNLPPVVVIGHGAEAVKEAVQNAYPGQVEFALQAEQLGTGHAIFSAMDALRGNSELVLVTCADMPMLQVETIEKIIDFHKQNENVLTMTSVEGDVPRGFGRMVRDKDGKLIAIVEEVDATAEQRKIREYNVSVYCFDAAWLWENLTQIQPSPKGEYYVTDLIKMAVEQGKKLDSVILDDPVEGLGVNNRIDLADCEVAMRKRVIRKWMLEGVSFLDPNSCTVESDVVIGKDTVILPNTHLRGNTVIGENNRIGPDTTIQDTTIGNDCRITYSFAEQAWLGNRVSMGPFSHLRPGAVLKDGVHLGNFGEVKDSTLLEDVKMGHFSYIGNAQIGKNVNIGAGTITCNFDGVHKHNTEIGENTFIGSDTMLVAPLKIGKNAKTGAGAVVNRDVPDDTLVYGVPARPKDRKD